MTNYFYLQLQTNVDNPDNPDNPDFVEAFREYAKDKKVQVYVLDRPLVEQQKYIDYSDNVAYIILRPKHKIAIIKASNVEREIFTEHLENIIEDIGYISDKYDYKKVLGRPRVWREDLISVCTDLPEDIEKFWGTLALSNSSQIKKIDLLISLLIGSINDIDRVKENVPEEVLAKVKQKIQLFDTDQTRFIYQTPRKKNIRIQGLSGTGKTELLLHKLKELYTRDENSRICFTCHNKILAREIRKRIPQFFNFMKVEQQIEWEKRLWCVNAWGSVRDENSGTYRYICEFYGLPFYSFGFMSFEQVCKLAKDEIEKLNNKKGYAFTYMFVDESQDFQPEFIKLCETVTEQTVYVAGDIFQSIFDDNILKDITPDFLLAKCYRTDPKTLMFAHALGMGLFEKNKLRWLDKKEWEDCGYCVEFTEKDYVLSRDPIRRFEDLDDSFESVCIVEETQNIPSEVVNVISKIKNEHTAVEPEDIGIIFLDTDQYIYEFASRIQEMVHKSYRWKVNKTYESKQRDPGRLLISNRNNVKGLEFPFVICVTKSIKDDIIYRNALYTMLTRSFIQSYLVTEEKLRSEIKQGWKQIHQNNKMTIREPDPAEKEKIQTRFKNNVRRLSLQDRLNEIFDEYNISTSAQESLRQMLKKIQGVEEWDNKLLSEWVGFNQKYVL